MTASAERGTQKGVAQGMGWETRQGGRYYYRKKRMGGRVVSQYVGCGAWVEAMSQLEQSDRMERADERDERRIQRERERAQEAAADQFTTLVETLTAGYLLAAGCHTHKRQWRRRR